MADLDSLQRTLDIHFNDVSLLEHSLIHSSYINENPAFTLTSNERLEFLGDAVLGLIVADKLFQDHPQLAEGEMTKLRAAMVRRDMLARIAQNIGLGDYLYLGKGEETSGGRNKTANLASAIEAVIAAIFLDQGLSTARDFIVGLIGPELEEVVKQGAIIDYKSQLQELIQAREQRPPTYHVTATTGPDHNRIFNVEVRLGANVLGTGSGKSKKAAETEAARSALETLSTDFTQ